MKNKIINSKLIRNLKTQQGKAGRKRHKEKERKGIKGLYGYVEVRLVTRN
jgi:hypothetical protein